MQRPDELYHYGIQGMRWGVRHGPPYPLYRQSSAWRSAHPSRGRIGGLATDYSDWVKKQGKKYRENLPNKVKYPVAVTAAGAVGLAAGANIAFTKRALTGIRDNAKNIPWIGPKLIPKAKEKAVKGAKGFFKMTGGKQRLIAAAALLTAAGVYAGVRKRKKARQEEIKRIRKERSKIGEMRETEAKKVKGVKGLFSGETADEKKAKSLSNKIEAERSSAKTVEKNGVKIKIQSKKLTESENMERVNNSFRIKRTRGNSENCIACSVTMEARRRGYEVKARTDLAHDDDSETSFKSVAKVYKNAKTMSLGTNAKSGSKAYESFYNNAEAKARKGNNTDLTKKLKTTTAKMPKGASGQICIMFDRWSGHSMYFYKDRNGKTIFYDTQRNKKYTEDQLNSMFIQNSSNIVMQRFDGCDINEKELLKYSK